MPEAELHAKTISAQKRGFLSATPFVHKFDFLIKRSDMGINYIKEGRETL